MYGVSLSFTITVTISSVTHCQLQGRKIRYCGTAEITDRCHFESGSLLGNRKEDRTVCTCTIPYCTLTTELRYPDQIHSKLESEVEALGQDLRHSTV